MRRGSYMYPERRLTCLIRSPVRDSQDLRAGRQLRLSASGNNKSEPLPQTGGYLCSEKFYGDMTFVVYVISELILCYSAT